MKIDSLFKDRAYAFPQTGDQEDDCRFALKVLEKVKPKFEPKEIFLWGVTDDYDIFDIINDKQEKFKLKISLSDPDKTLARETTVLKNSRCPSFPLFSGGGDTKIGENISYLLTKVISGDSIRNYGRSILLQDIDSFSKAYFEILKTKAVRQTYKKVLDTFVSKLVLSDLLTAEGKLGFEDYTDYAMFEEFLSGLQKEIQDSYTVIGPVFNYKSHGELSLDSVFYTGQEFYFDFLHNVCMSHPFVDLVDLILEMGLPPETEREVFHIFCENGGLAPDQSLYDSIYQLQLRKKLGELLMAYIKEVYVYSSYRYEKILHTADTFSHCYERFCGIKIFKEKREFILKTICEPIFGVKA